jgi:phospholipid/cholesterol/gamma-HCH transport system substrate-binding protein
MTNSRIKIGLAAVLVLVLIGGVVALLRFSDQQHRIHVTAYFANSNGIFAGDDVRVLGVPVGKIDRIEPQPDRAKITFWVDDRYKIPANAEAAVISPAVVSVRAIQLTPAYTGGPVMADNAVIKREHTAVPVEWDDLREQLQRLTETLQPTQPGGVSTLGLAINTAADNLRGQGANIHDTVVKLAQAFSALGDHSTDLFSTVKNISIVVSALRSSTDLIRQLNQNLAAVTGLLSNDPGEVGNAITDLNSVIGDVRQFVADNKETLGTTSDKLASVTTALNQSLDDLKQTLHVAPTLLQNFANIYQPAQGTLTGVLAVNNFADPVSFLCGAIQAASRLGYEQSAKLCAQYLAPIVKNRQYNFPPVGINQFVGAMARPNELSYSEDWMRPDYVPPPGPPPPAPTDQMPASSPGAPVAAEAPTPPAVPKTPLPTEARPTDPAAGLQGMMVPPGAGS